MLRTKHLVIYLIHNSHSDHLKRKRIPKSMSTLSDLKMDNMKIPDDVKIVRLMNPTSTDFNLAPKVLYQEMCHKKGWCVVKIVAVMDEPEEEPPKPPPILRPPIRPVKKTHRNKPLRGLKYDRSSELDMTRARRVERIFRESTGNTGPAETSEAIEL